MALMPSGVFSFCGFARSRNGVFPPTEQFFSELDDNEKAYDDDKKTGDDGKEGRENRREHHTQHISRRDQGVERAT